jgi:hypothetical protein
MKGHLDEGRMPLHLLGISRSSALTTLAYSACDGDASPAAEEAGGTPAPQVRWILHEDLAAATIAWNIPSVWPRIATSSDSTVSIVNGGG